MVDGLKVDGSIPIVPKKPSMLLSLSAPFLCGLLQSIMGLRLQFPAHHRLCRIVTAAPGVDEEAWGIDMDLPEISYFMPFLTRSRKA